jgi:nucleotide-binding universal stress UspA family protein
MGTQSRQVVVAVDGSENSLRALKAGADLARAMGRDLSLLYVYPNVLKDASAAMAGLPKYSAEQLESHKASSATEIFDASLAELANRLPVAKKHLLVGDPAAEIIGFMEANPGTHLVMGRRGLSKVRRLLIGSISDKVMRHAPGTVTVVS